MQGILKVIACLVMLDSLLLGGCTGSGHGQLGGHVEIGPLCPVEPCTITGEQRAGAYAARSIGVSTPEGTDVATIRIGPDGDYLIDLPAGDYIVDISHRGIDRSADVPRTITIMPGRITVVNISIDTGLR